MASAEQEGIKNPVKTGLFGSLWISLDFNLVETTGVEIAIQFIVFIDVNRN